MSPCLGYAERGNLRAKSATMNVANTVHLHGVQNGAQSLSREAEFTYASR